MMSDDYEVQIKTIEAQLRRLGLTEEQIFLPHSSQIKGWKASTDKAKGWKVKQRHHVFHAPFPKAFARFLKP